MNARVVKIKGEHDQNIQNTKNDSNALKQEIQTLKAQSDAEDEEKIMELKGKLMANKSAYDNVNNGNVTMHQIIKYFRRIY